MNDFRPQEPPTQTICQVCKVEGPAIPSFKAFYRLPEPWLGMLLKCPHGSLVFMTVCSEACAKKAWDEQMEDQPVTARMPTPRMVH